MDDSSKEYFKSSRLRFYENSKQTQTAQLLFATDDEYFFLVKPPEWKRTSTLNIKRDVIKSVLYKGLRADGISGSYELDTNGTNQPQSSPTSPVQTTPLTPDTSPSPSP